MAFHVSSVMARGHLAGSGLNTVARSNNAHTFSSYHQHGTHHTSSYTLGAQRSPLSPNMKLKDISRTATFAWDSSSSSSPLLATGAIAGALDESFSNESQLEIWSPDFGEGEGMYLGAEGKGAQGSITVNSRWVRSPATIADNRFNRLAWSAPNASHARGVLAAGMETGEVNVFDPEKIISGAG